MAVMDEFREEREAIKNAPRKEKWEYYWEYYRAPVLGTLLAIICIVSIIVSIVSKPEYVLRGYVVNRYWFMDEGQDLQPFADEYLEYRGYDTEKYEIEMNGSLSYNPTSEDVEVAESALETAQLIGARCATGTLDFMIADIEMICQFEEADYFMDLRDVYSEDELKEYEELLVYSTQDSSMPIAIDVTECQKMKDIYGIRHEQLVISFMGTAEHVEECRCFVEYILQDN